MQSSEQTDAIDAALAAAQAEIKNPIKNHMNPHFRTKYADLTDGLDVIRPTLSKHGIAILQATTFSDGFVTLVTRLAHKGQWYQSTYPVAPFGDHQRTGAGMTYARRQSLFALCGVAGDSDNDGEDIPKESAQSRAAAEAAAYVAQAEKEIADIDSVDRMGTWWNAEKKNRALHFHSNDDPLLERLKKAAADRSAALKAEAGE